MPHLLFLDPCQIFSSAGKPLKKSCDDLRVAMSDLKILKQELTLDATTIRFYDQRTIPQKTRWISSAEEVSHAGRLQAGDYRFGEALSTWLPPMRQRRLMLFRQHKMPRHPQLANQSSTAALFTKALEVPSLWSLPWSISQSL